MCLNIAKPSLSIGENFGGTNHSSRPTVMDVGGFKFERIKHSFPSISNDNSEGLGNRLKLDYSIVFNNVPEHMQPVARYVTSAGVTVYDAITNGVRRPVKISKIYSYIVHFSIVLFWH
jgi:hypothetical protein